MSFYEKFYPKVIFSSVLDITLEYLNKNNIKALFLDIDNTLMDYDGVILDGLPEWIEQLKLGGIKFCIVSNTSHKYKAEKISKLLNVPFYIYFAKKPLKSGFNKAIKIVKEKNENIGAVGDQIMTDIYGANRNKMFSILVKPIKNRDIFITKINRIFERKILRQYYKTHNS